MLFEKRLGKFLGILMVAVVASSSAQTKHPPARADQSATTEKIIRYVRERFNIPGNVKLVVGPFRDSAYPDFHETTILVGEGADQRSQKFFVSKDGRYLVEGNIYTLGADPKQEVVRSISFQNQPTQGAANASVTIVEYADLQCPNCARFHDFLEKEIMPKYGDKIRVVFKEFPLTNIHDWALSAAIASQCVYQIEPASFVPFRTLVYQNQIALTADNARDMLLHYGAQAGVDNAKLASCLDSKASLPRVEASTQEGQALGIASTPTSFINGKVLVGTPEPAEFFKILDEALSTAK